MQRLAAGRGNYLLDIFIATFFEIVLLKKRSKLVFLKKMRFGGLKAFVWELIRVKHLSGSPPSSGQFKMPAGKSPPSPLYMFY